MIKGCMFYVAGYDRPIEIVSRIEEDKTDYIYKDGKLVDTIINDDIKLLKVLQKIVEEMKRKAKKMETKSKTTKSNRKKEKDTLTTTKVGDKLYSVEDGWGTVTDIVDGEYPLCLKFGLNRATFTLDGKRHTHSKYPILFSDKVKIKSPKKLKKPNKSSKSGKQLPDLTLDTAVLVWEVNGEKKLRRHFRKFNRQGRIVCFADGKTSYTIGKGMRMSWRYWELAK